METNLSGRSVQAAKPWLPWHQAGMWSVLSHQTDPGCGGGVGIRGSREGLSDHACMALSLVRESVSLVLLWPWLPLWFQASGRQPGQHHRERCLPGSEAAGAIVSAHNPLFEKPYLFVNWLHCGLSKEKKKKKTEEAPVFNKMFAIIFRAYWMPAKETLRPP